MMRKLLLYLFLVAFGFGLAFAVRVPVTRFIKESRLDLVQMIHSYTGVPTTTDRWSDEDVNALVSLDSAAALFELRQSLQALIFGQWNATEEIDFSLESGIADVRYSDMTGLQRIDRIEIGLEYGLQSIVYWFVPESPSGAVVIYHQGHAGDFYKGRHVIESSLATGAAVAAFAMPLLGMNSVAELQHPKLGPLAARTHDHLSLFKPQSGSTLKFFLQPVKAVVDYLASQGYADFSMIGVSGGGWTTALYAALDDRITLSMPVAGSLPMRYKFKDANSLGDFESRDPELFALASYPEIYLLGSFGEGRVQVQVSNYYDPCCYSGDAPLEYKDALASVLARLGPGRFDVFIDYAQTRHQISQTVVDEFLTLLQNQRSDV